MLNSIFSEVIHLAFFFHYLIPELPEYVRSVLKVVNFFYCEKHDHGIQDQKHQLKLDFETDVLILNLRRQGTWESNSKIIT